MSYFANENTGQGRKPAIKERGHRKSKSAWKQNKRSNKGRAGEKGSKERGGKRKIRNIVEDKISELIITNSVKEGDTLSIKVVDNHIDVTIDN